MSRTSLYPTSFDQVATVGSPDTASTKGLLDVPDEILSQIMSIVFENGVGDRPKDRARLHTDRRHLGPWGISSFLLVCRRFYRVAFKEAYENVDWKFRYKRTSVNADPTADQMRSLLQKLPSVRLACLRYVSGNYQTTRGLLMELDSNKTLWPMVNFGGLRPMIHDGIFCYACGREISTASQALMFMARELMAKGSLVVWNEVLFYTEFYLQILLDFPRLKELDVRFRKYCTNGAKNDEQEQSAVEIFLRRMRTLPMSQGFVFQACGFKDSLILNVRREAKSPWQSGTRPGFEA